MIRYTYVSDDELGVARLDGAVLGAHGAELRLVLGLRHQGYQLLAAIGSPPTKMCLVNGFNLKLE